MIDVDRVLRPPGPRGCLGSVAGLAALAVMSPFVLIVRSWRRWRRGDDVRMTLAVSGWPERERGTQRRIDAAVDVPLGAESDFRRRLTDAVVRIAEALRRPDDAYNVIYRMPLDEEAVVLPVGPQVQELGERFFLVLNQGSLVGRTVVWLTLGRGTALSRVADPLTSDPEAAGEPDRLLASSGARWAMATEWARVGPSLVVRIVLVVPSTSSEAVCDRLRALQMTRFR